MSETFSTRLKQSIDGRQLTQRQLAILTGTTEQSISRYLKSKRIPNADVLYKLCVALDVSADYLLGLSDEPQNNIGDVKADKDKLELLNLRKRVESQREEIKKLSEQQERNKSYIRELDNLISKALVENDALKESYMLLTMTA